MNRIILTAILLMTIAAAGAQDMTKFKLYNPAEDAEKAIAAAVQEAKEAGKHVMIQVGGNWCIWCARFNDFTTGDEAIHEYIKNNYVVYHLNYSPENKNKEVLARYGYPQRFGFPVFLILDGDGKLIHTENSAYLEEGKGYGKLKVIEFLKNWSKAAFDPAQYKDQ
jgi:thioredoxin-related protein